MNWEQKKAPAATGANAAALNTKIYPPPRDLAREKFIEGLEQAAGELSSIIDELRKLRSGGAR